MPSTYCKVIVLLIGGVVTLSATGAAAPATQPQSCVTLASAPPEGEHAGMAYIPAGTSTMGSNRHNPRSGIATSSVSMVFGLIGTKSQTRSLQSSSPAQATAPSRSGDGQQRQDSRRSWRLQAPSFSSCPQT